MGDSQYGYFFITPFWRLECWCGFYDSGKFVHPTHLVHGRYAIPPQQHVTTDSFYIRPRFFNLTLKTSDFHPRGTLLYPRTWRRLCHQQTDFAESPGRRLKIHSLFSFSMSHNLTFGKLFIEQRFLLGKIFDKINNFIFYSIHLKPLINQVSSWKRCSYRPGEGIIPPPAPPSPFVTQRSIAIRDLCMTPMLILSWVPFLYLTSFFHISSLLSFFSHS